MKFFSKKITLVILGCAFLFACTEDYFEFDKIVVDEIRPEFAIPLVNSSLSLEDILANEDTNGVITTDNTGALEILYEGNVVSGLGVSNVPIPDILETTTISSIPSPPPGVQATIPASDTVELNLNTGIEADSIRLKSGSLVINFNSTVRHPISVLVEFPGMKNANGQILSKTISIPPYNGVNPSVRAEVEVLDDYLLDLTLNGTTFNKIAINLSATITGAAGVPTGTTGNLQLTANFRLLEFKDFYGYFGQEPIDLIEDTILIGLFKNFDQGRFYISDPVIDIIIKNSYGMPVNLAFDYLDALTPESTIKVKKIDLQGNDPISLLYPIGNGVEITNVRLDKNGNIPEIISDLVKEIAFDANAIPNPTGRTDQNYISDTSSIGLDVKLKIPLKGFASGFRMSDTVDFEFEGADEIDNALVRTRVENGFPIQAELQLVFTDGNFMPLDSLYSQGQEIIIPSAPVGSNGRSTSTALKDTDTELTQSRFQNLVNTKHILVKARLETTNGSAAAPDTITFLPSYKLDIAVGIKAQILID